MIDYERFELDNGLRCLVHEDDATPLAAVNVMYDVGSKDEDPAHTGFAHLFEHLMFGGSKNIPDYDKEAEKVGGENNAFTSTDVTNYFLTLPAPNIETAFWLESDRMKELAFSEKSLEVQRSVVVEEFRQVYLNQPYGEAMLELRPMAFKEHPYRWPTIGREIEHIEQTRMEDVKAFFDRFYHPANAILVVGGNVKKDEVKRLVEKWFGDIPAGPRNDRRLPEEPPQKEERSKTLEQEVPLDAIYRAYPMPGRVHSDFHAADLLSDHLGRGDSARLYEKLVKQEERFSDIDAYVTGETDHGLLILEGRLRDGVSFDAADAGLDRVLDEVRTGKLGEEEFEKLRNKVETSKTLSDMKVLHKCIELAFGEVMGDPNMVNEELERYHKVQPEELRALAERTLRPENRNTLYYKRPAS
ncbi:MAG: M16 family metallopeptidase [Flavobacteriales bacterium]